MVLGPSEVSLHVTGHHSPPPHTHRVISSSQGNNVCKATVGIFPPPQSDDNFREANAQEMIIAVLGLHRQLM